MGTDDDTENKRREKKTTYLFKKIWWKHFRCSVSRRDVVFLSFFSLSLLSSLSAYTLFILYMCNFNLLFNWIAQVVSGERSGRSEKEIGESVYVQAQREKSNYPFEVRTRRARWKRVDDDRMWMWMQEEVCNKKRIRTNIVYRWIPSIFFLLLIPLFRGGGLLLLCFLLLWIVGRLN